MLTAMLTQFAVQKSSFVQFALQVRALLSPELMKMFEKPINTPIMPMIPYSAGVKIRAIIILTRKDIPCEEYFSTAFQATLLKMTFFVTGVASPVDVCGSL